MISVRAKKHLGQHFLHDTHIANQIVESLIPGLSEKVLEIGPGKGVLSAILLQKTHFDTRFVEIDRESVEYLTQQYPSMGERIFREDFLRFNLSAHFASEVSIIGNLPYNISSQIFFKVLEHRNQIPQVVCMIQKEVAERIAAPPGSKTYGILSVLLQAYYTIEYLFTVHEHVFTPPPKVKSGVIRLVRSRNSPLPCNETLFKQVVKTGFNQRRKTLLNSLKPLLAGNRPSDPIFLQRPEQLSVEQFIALTQRIADLQTHQNHAG